MKIVARPLARTIWVVDQQQLNPEGRSLWELYQALAKRYHFSKAPQHLVDYNDKGALEFLAGTFIKHKKLDLRVGLTFYNNAVVADSLSSTDDSELFLQDVASWLSKEYSLPVDSALIRKSYFNQLDVKFDFPLQFLNPKLAFVQNRLNSEAKSIDGKSVPFGFGGFSVWTENMGSQQALNFRLEHKHDTDFAKGIYFSSAPLQTSEHIALLEDIEKALRPTNGSQ